MQVYKNMVEISPPVRWHDPAGFTLIEVMIAMVVLVVGVFALQQMQIASIQGNSSAQMLTAGSTWAADRTEQLINTPDYTDPMINDADGDGLAGLNDTEVNGIVTADFVASQNDTGLAVVDVITGSGQALPTTNATPYFVYWNVASNSAVANSRIIRVITVWTDRGQIKNTVVEYVRPNKFWPLQW